MGRVPRPDGARRVLAGAPTQGRTRVGGAAGIVAVVAACALLAACGSSSKAPAAGSTITQGGTTAGKTTKVAINITDAGCAPEPASVDAGNTEFDLANNNSDAVSEAELKTEDGTHILGEKENLTPGLSATFTQKLSAGNYKIVCAGAKQSSWSFTVKGADTASGA